MNGLDDIYVRGARCDSWGWRSEMDHEFRERIKHGLMDNDTATQGNIRVWIGFLIDAPIEVTFGEPGDGIVEISVEIRDPDLEPHGYSIRHKIEQMLAPRLPAGIMPRVAVSFASITDGIYR